MALYRMVNGIQRYAWGSTTEFSRLTGIPNPQGEPMAELWMGDHPRMPSELLSGKQRRSLGSFLSDFPDFALGPTVASRFGGRLPFLFKLLSAEQGLSIQVHPSPSQAREGYDRENAAGIPLDAPHRNYKDYNHKPEVILAVTPFWALSGFRPPRKTAEDFRAIGGAGRLVGRLEAGDLAGFYRELMDPQAPDLLPGARDYCRRRLLEAGISPERDQPAPPKPAPPKPGPESRFAWVLELERQFPGDRGALAPLYLNCLHLDPGEALFLESGLLHAYLHGTGVELMANSDNVLRGGCTVKHVDLPELLRIVRFEATENPRFPGERQELPGVVSTIFAPPVEEFRLSRLEISGHSTVEKGPSPAIAFVLGAPVMIRQAPEASVEGPEAFPGATELSLSPGESLFVPAAVVQVTIEGSGVVYLASV